MQLPMIIQLLILLTCLVIKFLMIAVLWMIVMVALITDVIVYYKYCAKYRATVSA